VLIKNRNALVLSRMVDTSFVASRRIQCASSVRRGGSKLEDAERVQSSRLALIDYMCDVRCAMCDVQGVLGSNVAYFVDFERTCIRNERHIWSQQSVFDLGIGHGRRGWAFW
jgi:hypothetical protein